MSNSPDQLASSRLRKAAIVLASLDGGLAQQVLRQLPREQIAQLRSIQQELRQVPTEETEHAVLDFRMAWKNRDRDELMISSLEDTPRASNSSSQTRAEPGPQQASLPPSAQTNTSGPQGPFAVLSTIAPAQLAARLRSESPQTLAVVLHHLSPDQAAALLAELPANVQSSALERLPTIGEVNPLAQEAIAAELTEWAHQKDSQTRANGSDSLAAIAAKMKTAQRQARREPLSEPQQSPALTARTSRFATAPDVAQSARSQRPAISSTEPGETTEQLLDRLPQLPVQAARTLVEGCDIRTLTLALLEFDPRKVRSFLDKLPRKIAHQIKRQLRNPGELSLQELTTARMKLARQVARFVTPA